jgi:hypothetical protein
MLVFCAFYMPQTLPGRQSSGIISLLMLKTKSTSPTSRSRKTISPLWYVVAAVFLILAVGVVLELTNVTHVFHKSLPITTASEETKGEPGASAGSQTSTKKSNATTSDNQTQPGDQKSDGGGDSTASLLAPSGVFISNHHPGENGSPMSETSVCTTTPGATCQIAFTKDGVTKSLQTQTTDRGGSTYWNSWNPGELLTPGSWRVQATASLNGQSKSSTDAIELVVPQ